MKKIINEINNYTPVTLEKINEWKLLKRFDTKFTFEKNKLAPLLKVLSPYYNILEINNERVFQYETLYYDTDDLSFYHHHHNKKLSRFKIRFREYTNTGLCFFEIKSKSNTGKTVKIRKKTDKIMSELSKNLNNYIDKNIPDELNIKSKDISPSLWTIFTRITLVNKVDKERLTIDLNLNFKNCKSNKKNSMKALDNLIIVELKQGRLSLESPFFKAIREKGIQPSSFSKYSIGTAMLNTKIKRNRFKKKLIAIDKINKGGVYA